MNYKQIYLNIEEEQKELNNNRLPKRAKALLEDVEDLLAMLEEVAPNATPAQLLRDSEDAQRLQNYEDLKTVSDYHRYYDMKHSTARKTKLYNLILNGADTLTSAVYRGTFLIFDEDIKAHYLTPSEVKRAPKNNDWLLFQKDCIYRAFLKIYRQLVKINQGGGTNER